jgi:Fe-S-cluster containining protein
LTINADVCPCGSGKIWKECCGSSIQLSKPGHFGIHRYVAYQGSVGKQRQTFCIDFITQKHSRIVEMGIDLKIKAELAGNSISCSQGCSKCCSLYVSATLQECEAIVYYLYQDDKALHHFLTQFVHWREGMEQIGNTVYDISLLQEKIFYRRGNINEIQAFEDQLTIYNKQNLPCPFLSENICSIYEVRPYVCARLASTSPREWCDFQNPDHEHLEIIKAVMDIEKDIPYFVGTRATLSFTCMPSLVYEILNHGWSFLSSIPWFRDLKPVIMKDSNLLHALTDAGITF